MSFISKKAQGMSSAAHIKKSLAVGEGGERRFYNSCKASNMDIKKTSRSADMHKHCDFVVDGESYDVKGLKNSHKKGQLLLEVKNVNGKLGWCNSKKKPEMIAFDFGGFFFCARNSDLHKLIKKRCNLRKKVKKIDDALYKGYSRRNRSDLMTLVNLLDAMNDCEHWILPYEDYHPPMDLL